MIELHARRRARPRTGWLAAITVAAWPTMLGGTWHLTRGDYHRTFPSSLWFWAVAVVLVWTGSAWWALSEAGAEPKLTEVRADQLRLAASRPGAAALDPGPRLEAVDARWHAVLGAYGAFLCDIVAIASMPLLSDPTCPSTDRFRTALVAAEDAHAQAHRDPARLLAFLEAVEQLERTWREAKSYAHRKGYSTFEDPERDAVRRAQHLLDIALDGGAFGPERREAMRKAIELLRTVVEVPTQAVSAIDHRVQRLELES